ncbi:MAG: hypothetical protein AB7T48_01535 [Solirubrobacterales bacterium]
MLAATASVLIVTASAQAAPATPVLTGTTPKSPNVTLTPQVRGSSTGVIISSVPHAVDFAATTAFAPVTTAAEGETVVSLYAGAGCEGTPIAEGSPAELDGDGIQITVAPESTTVVSARQSDESGPSGCSNAIQYQHVKELPPAEEPPTTPPTTPGLPPTAGDPISGPPSPPRLRTIPGGFANDNTPVVTGNAPASASTVRIYADPECKGQPVAKGAAATFATSGFELTVVDNVAVVLSGVAANAAGASPCSAPILYVEDSTIPRTKITMGPASKTRKRTAIFRFRDSTGDAPGTSFFCKVDKRKWKRCSSPLRVRKLKRKPHVVRVRAIDAAGNAEKKGAKRRFKVVPPA